MDRVSFTGIKNINITKETYEQFGPYLPLNYANKAGRLQDITSYGKKKYNEILIQCDLTNDAQGNDLAEFIQQLKKSKVQYEFNCINYDKSNHVDLFLKRFDVKDEIGHTSNSEFKINGYPIYLNERDILPIYTFMAKLSRKISEMTDLPEEWRKYAKFVNRSVHKEATEFIENM